MDIELIRFIYGKYVVDLYIQILYDPVERI